MTTHLFLCSRTVVALGTLLFLINASAATVERHVLVERKAPPNDALVQFRRQGWEDLIPQALAMDREIEENGFAVVPKATVNHGKERNANIAALTRVSGIQNLGFSPAVLQGPEIQSAQLVGVSGSVPSKDGLVHGLVRKYRHPDLGDIFISEYSFATDPDVTEYAVRKATGNLYINGEPASVWPMRAPDGSERTNITYYTKSVIYSVDVYKTLPIGSSELAILERFVQALY